MNKQNKFFNVKVRAVVVYTIPVVSTEKEVSKVIKSKIGKRWEGVSPIDVEDIAIIEIEQPSLDNLGTKLKVKS